MQALILTGKAVGRTLVNLAQSSSGSGMCFGTNAWTYVSLVLSSGDNTQVTIAARFGYWARATTGMAWIDDPRLEP